MKIEKTLIAGLLLMVFAASCGDVDTVREELCHLSPAGGTYDPLRHTCEPTPDPTPRPSPAPTPEPTPDGDCEVEFDTTFDVVQEIFTNKCVSCHGDSINGDLDLREGVAYDNIFEVDSAASDDWRVYPGDTERSFLYQKIAKWRDDSIVISGGAMPQGEPLSEVEQDLIRFWIYSGAPEDVMVQGTDEILQDTCLAPAEPFTIEPLDPPAAEDGVQIVMPITTLAKASETETCVAVYEDFCDQVPAQYRVPNSDLFMVDATEIRMPPFSHHLLIQIPQDTFGGQTVNPNNLQGWACAGGGLHGQTCDPLVLDFCGDEGRCATPLRGSTACIGYGPSNGINSVTFTGTQQPQFYAKNYDGVFGYAPCKSVIYYNLHAFNLTSEDVDMTAQVNFEFATNPLWPARRKTTDPASSGLSLGSFGISRLTGARIAPYTEETLCTDVEIPQGCYLTGATSHNHRLGARAWWTNPEDEIFYESWIYNDPTVLRYDTPIPFLDADPATRTFEFCTTYRNGLDAEGNLEPEKMSRASEIPYTFGGPITANPGCDAYRCVNEGVDRLSVNCDDGNNGNGKGDDSKCDSTPGAGDGFCDACNILGGVTTQNEMYQGTLSYFCPTP